jgi:hypothetical protein
MASLNLFEEFAALTRALDALAVHGFPRFTKDIDLLVPRDALERVKGVAKAQGFVAESLPMRFGGGRTEIHRIIKLAGNELLMLDLLVVTEALEPVWNAREQLALTTGSVWTVSRQGLVQMKLDAGRPQDLLDIAKLSEVS